MQAVLDSPVAADDPGQFGGPCLDDGQRGDHVDRLGRPLLAVLPGQLPSAAHDLDGLGGVGEGQSGRYGGDLQGSPFGAPVAFLAGLAGDGDLPPGQRGELGVQAGLVALDQEGDRLRRFRGQLPCEVVVTAVTHPLYGCRLRAYAVRHVDGVPHLKVELPDGMPGLVAAEATDALGADPAGAGAGLVLDGDGLRRLRAVVVRLRDGDASGPRR